MRAGTPNGRNNGQGAMRALFHAHRQKEACKDTHVITVRMGEVTRPDEYRQQRTLKSTDRLVSGSTERGQTSPAEVTLGAMLLILLPLLIFIGMTRISGSW